MKRILMISVVSAGVLLYACSSSKPDNTLQDTLKTNEAMSAKNSETMQSGHGAAQGKAIEQKAADQTGVVVNTDPQVQRQYSDKPVDLTTADFKRLVFDMDKNPSQWVYNGDLPALVDFYAVWCGPCKMAAPALEELAREYSGKVNFYKVDAEKERFLSNYFRVQGYPSFMVIPANGQPRMFTGLPAGVRTQSDIKPAFKKIIESELL